MKKSLKNIAALAVLFTSMTAMATEPKINLIPGDEPKSLVVELDSPSNGSEIKLTDQKAQVLYSESVKNADYAKKFNLKNLEAGTYYFTIENALASVIYRLDVNQEKVTVSGKEEKSLKPIFNRKGDRVYVNLVNADLKRVDIEILDEKGRTIYEESRKGEATFGKVFNFERAEKGRYTITVRGGEGTYRQHLVI